MENAKRWLDASLTPRERAEALAKELTVEEKLAQLAGVFAYPGAEDRMAAFLKNGIGQISSLEFRNRQSYAEAAAWQRQLQQIVMDASRLHIPAVFHMEGLCGPLMPGSMSFPSGIARGASFHPETEEKIGQIVSRQELACGITQILAPVLDISRDPRMGRTCEPYSEDGTLAAELGAAYTKGIQENEQDGRKAESVAKHFLGFHNSQGGIHGANAQIDDGMLREQFAKPFEAAVRESGLRGVMPCYCSLNGLPVHASETILTGLLREELGFEGVVVSDYGGADNAHKVQNIGETMGDIGYLCLKAGMDVELPMPSAYSAELAEKFHSGEADMAVLDRAVLRVLEAKFRMGIFEHPFALEGADLKAVFENEADRAVTLQSARESLVLLKNDGALPLTGKAKKIALIGPHTNNARFFFGGYTEVSMVEASRAAMNSMAGVAGAAEAKEMKTVPGTNVQSDDGEEFQSILPLLHPGCRGLCEELTARLPEAEIVTAFGYPIFGADESCFADALEAAKDADVILLTLGGKNGSGSVATMGEGVDGTDINLPKAQDAFILAAKALGKPMIGVHLDGRPISSDVADANLDAILECWSPSEAGAEAIADVLLGKINPSGKLPVSVARSAGQVPVWYNHVNGSEWHQARSIGFQDYVDMPHTPRYEFGFGLSYTTFEYSDFVLSADSVAPDGSVTVSARITNTGAVAGTEIAQLYLRDEFASRMRPVKELAGFVRVDMQPGESRTVRFTVAASQTAFYVGEKNWLVEKGEIGVQLGASSEDIRLSGSFRIADNAVIRGRDRALWAKATIE